MENKPVWSDSCSVADDVELLQSDRDGSAGEKPQGPS